MTDSKRIPDLSKPIWTQASDALKHILSERGIGVCAQPAVLESMLRQQCPGGDAVQYLLAGLSDDIEIAQSVLAALRSGDLSPVRAMLRQTLQDSRFMDPVTADWTVATWISAIEAGLKTPPSRDPILEAYECAIRKRIREMRRS